MDRIRNAIKCVQCKSTLAVPIILPCSHSICQKHVDGKTSVRCEKCGADHDPPPNGFPKNDALAEIIGVGIEELDMGDEHEKAKHSIELLKGAIEASENLLRDPVYITHERISGLKNDVSLKGEILKLKIDSEVSRLHKILDEYETSCNSFIGSDEFKTDLALLEAALKKTKRTLDECCTDLNRLRVDPKMWRTILDRSVQETNFLKREMRFFRDRLLLQKFGSIQTQVDHFKKIKIGHLLAFRWNSFNSSILNPRLKEILFELLRSKFPSNSRWDLVYECIQDEYDDSNLTWVEASETLRIIETESYMIIGGYMKNEWRLLDDDFNECDFVFGLGDEKTRPFIKNPKVDGKAEVEKMNIDLDNILSAEIFKLC